MCDLHLLDQYFSYWGSYNLVIPGGSGAGNAVEHLSLPENAPEFFKFAAFNNQPLAAPVFNPVALPAPAARPAPTPKQVRPAPQQQQLRVFQPQSVARPAQAPQQVRTAPQQVGTAPQQVRPAPQQQQLRVIQPRPVARQPQRIRPAPQQQFRQQPQPVQALPNQAQPAAQPKPADAQPQRFQNFATRTEEKQSAPQIQPQTITTVSEVTTDETKVAPIDTSNLSRFELYQLRQKKKQQQIQSVKLEESAPIEVKKI